MAVGVGRQRGWFDGDVDLDAGGFWWFVAGGGWCGADGWSLVTMVLPNQIDPSGLGTCGQAVQPGQFSVMTIETNANCQNRKAVVHELGHNLWAGHNVDNPAPRRAYPEADPGPSGRCTIMHNAFGCRRLVFSTPYRDFPGTDLVAGSLDRFNADAVSQFVSFAAGYRSPPVQGGGTYTAVSPQRVLDSRPWSSTHRGGYSTAWAPGETRAVSVAGNAAIPGGATAVVVTVTSTDSSANGFLRVYPWGEAPPSTATMNFAAGVARASTAIVKLGQYGLVQVYSNQSTHVVMDVVGYFGGNLSATSGLGVLPPVRAYNSFASGVPWAAWETRPIDLSGAGVPANAVAAVVSLAAFNAGSNGYLSVGSSAVSSLNYQVGSATANLVFAPASSGSITVYAHTVVDVIVDVLGFVGPSGVLEFTPVAQTRLVNGTTVGAGGSLEVVVAGIGGVPSGAGAVVVNVTGAGAVSPTWLLAFSTGSAEPSTSTVNVQPGSAKNNLAVVVPGSQLKATIRNGPGQVGVYVDLGGYFS